jgi:hypothetical protein
MVAWAKRVEVVQNVVGQILNDVPVGDFLAQHRTIKRIAEPESKTKSHLRLVGIKSRRKINDMRERKGPADEKDRDHEPG